MRRASSQNSERSFVCTSSNQHGKKVLTCRATPSLEEFVEHEANYPMSARPIWTSPQVSNGTCSGKTCDNQACSRSPCVQLSYVDIPNLTYDIYHQFRRFPTSPIKFLEVTKNVSYPVSRIEPGVEVVPGSLVYGYNLNGSIDLAGGIRKSHNPEFRNFKVQFCSVTDSEMVTLSQSIMQTAYQKIVPYFYQRGYSLANSDKINGLGDFYHNVAVSATGRLLGLRFMNRPSAPGSMNPWDVPDFVHLYLNSTYQTSSPLPYQEDPSQYQNGGCYPLEIPITTDFCGEFNAKYDFEPIAYWDESCGNLTIHVPEVGSGFYNYFWKSVFGSLNQNLQSRILACDGTFKLMKRDATGQFVQAGFSDFECLVQVSPAFYQKHRATNGTNVTFNGLPPGDSSFTISTGLFSTVAPFGSIYTGVVLVATGGDNPGFNVNAFPNIPNANVFIEQPLDSSVFECAHHHDNADDKGRHGRFLPGDNPTTRFVEGNYLISGTNNYDNIQRTQTDIKFPVAMITGQYYPEQAASAPVPTAASNQEIWTRVMGHEFLHASQHWQSGGLGVPSESMATGIEQDPKISGGVIPQSRTNVWSRITARQMRGLMAPMYLEDSPVSGYGQSILWTYLREQFDTNNQIIRRTCEIQGSKAVDDLFDAAGVAKFLISCETAGHLALDRALRELYNRNLKDTFQDYCIMLCMLRNNTSIPVKYRTQFPYWIYQTQYSGYPQVLAANTPLGSVTSFSIWWEMMQNDAAIPANWTSTASNALLPASLGIAGQSFIRTLPPTFSDTLRDMRNLAFSVPSSTNTVTVTITQGEWRISLLQFTSDNTPAGQFIIDGPHPLNGSGSKTFNVAAHVPAFTATGKIRLVCTHVSLTDLGGLNNYIGVQPITGAISISSA